MLREKAVSEVNVLSELILRKEVHIMEKKKTKAQRLLEMMAIKVATVDANTACPCITYQPKLPISVKKLRKF